MLQVVWRFVLAGIDVGCAQPQRLNLTQHLVAIAMMLRASLQAMAMAMAMVANYIQVITVSE